MPIAVICPGCHKRFNVSDKFAGKKGPCPECKTVISIPDKSEEVVIHAPEQFGPKGASGEAVLKPIERQETKFTRTAVVGTVAFAILVPLIALLLRFTVNLEDDTLRRSVLGLGAFLIAPPIVLLGYTFLRDDELEPYAGQALWLRVAICSAVYAVTWGLYLYVVTMLGFESAPELPHLVYLVPGLVVCGAIAALATLDLESILAAVHYCFYLGISVVLRLIMGLGPF